MTKAEGYSRIFYILGRWEPECVFSWDMFVHRPNPIESIENNSVTFIGVKSYETSEKWEDIKIAFLQDYINDKDKDAVKRLFDETKIGSDLLIVENKGNRGPQHKVGMSDYSFYKNFEGAPSVLTDICERNTP